jgi:hypothetical protein
MKLGDSPTYNKIEATITSNVFGEYFGHSLATVDVNGDGVDELIVGVPFFSSEKGEYDEGRVLIYESTPNKVKIQY